MTSMSHHAIIAGICVCLLLSLDVNAQPVPGANDGESHAVVPLPEDSALKQAKDAYAKRVAEIDQANARMIEQALQEARKRAAQNKAEKLESARVALIAAYDAAIQRAIERRNLDLAGRLTTERLEIAGLGVPDSDIDHQQLLDDQIYRCVLGTYGRFGRSTRYPIVNLSVPNRDLFTPAIQDKLRGKIDFFEINYRGDAKLIIHEEGIYTIELPGRGTGLTLNGKKMNIGDVKLAKGVYKIQITTGTHGQPYLPESFVRIRHKGTNKQIPLVNSGADIKEFLKSPIDGHIPVEVSGYRPQAIDTVLDDS